MRGDSAKSHRMDHFFVGNLKFNQSNQPNTDKEQQEKVCPFCGQSSQTVFVHGHEQCVFCKTNVEPCCQGEVQELDWTDNYDR